MIKLFYSLSLIILSSCGMNMKLLLQRGLWICPMFSNLTSLVLGHCCMAADFDALLCILQRSPKLKELTFKLERVLTRNHL